MPSNEDLIIAALEELGSKVGDLKRGYVHASCPLAAHRHEGGVDNNPSFGVVYNSGEAHKPEGHAHCFSCGYSGDIREIASLRYAWKDLDADQLENVMSLMEQVKEHKLPLSLSSHTADDPFPDAEWLASFPPVSGDHTAAVEYLASRGFDRDTYQAFDVRFDMNRYRVSFPLYDRTQRCRGMIGRTLIVNPEGPRYFYYPYPNASGVSPKGFTWFNEHRLDLAKPVLVVEGIFDAMKAWMAYKNTTAALSIGFRRPGLGWHTGVKRWVSMFDVGEGGKRARERLDELAQQTGAQVWHLPPPPGRDDPGESTPSEILTQLNSLG